MVKGAPKVLKNVPSDSRNSPWNIVNAEQVIEQSACLRITPITDYVRIGVEIGFDFGL